MDQRLTTEKRLQQVERPGKAAQPQQNRVGRRKRKQLTLAFLLTKMTATRILALWTRRPQTQWQQVFWIRVSLHKGSASCQTSGNSHSSATGDAIVEEANSHDARVLFTKIYVLLCDQNVLAANENLRG